MARYDFTTRRLYVESPLSPAARLVLPSPSAHYLRNVLRLSDGAELLVFNGRDGEWRAALASAGRKQAFLDVRVQTRHQPAPGHLHYLFAPLKHARLDYMVQKAVELGASALQPVLTRRTQAERFNLERMRANAIEAAEQCGVLSVPDILAPVKFDALISGWPAERLLVFCDEEADVHNPVDALSRAPRADSLAVLIGPEGGFEAMERAELAALPKAVRISLGPRILRADTAAVAALALVQAVLGDWRGDVS